MPPSSRSRRRGRRLLEAQPDGGATDDGDPRHDGRQAHLAAARDRGSSQARADRLGEGARLRAARDAEREAERADQEAQRAPRLSRGAGPRRHARASRMMLVLFDVDQRWCEEASGLGRTPPPARRGGHVRLASSRGHRRGSVPDRAPGAPHGQPGARRKGSDGEVSASPNSFRPARARSAATPRNASISSTLHWSVLRRLASRADRCRRRHRGRRHGSPPGRNPRDRLRRRPGPGRGGRRRRVDAAICLSRGCRLRGHSVGSIGCLAPYTSDVKQIWTGRMAQAAGKYGEHAPMAAVCCNACRTCVTTNVLTLLTGAAAGAALLVVRFVRRLSPRPT